MSDGCSWWRSARGGTARWARLQAGAPWQLHTLAGERQDFETPAQARQWLAQQGYAQDSRAASPENPEAVVQEPLALAVPPPVQRLVDAADAPARLAWLNGRGGLTFRIGSAFVKWNPHGSGLDLEAERARLAWAIRWHPVPAVLEAGGDEAAQWLVTAALPGRSAVLPPWRDRPLEAAHAIGRGLRRLHDALPVAQCPFDWSVEARIGHRAGGAAIGMPAIDRLVVCHGDACSPNTVLGDDGEPVGHVDLGSLGVADRWADLAVGSMNLDWPGAAGWEAAFFAGYGIAPDEERIRFYRHLWEHEDEISR